MFFLSEGCRLIAFWQQLMKHMLFNVKNGLEEGFIACRDEFG